MIGKIDYEFLFGVKDESIDNTVVFIDIDNSVNSKC